MAMSDKMVVHVTIDDKVLEALKAASEETKALRQEMRDMRWDLDALRLRHEDAVKHISDLERLPGVAEALAAQEKQSGVGSDK